MKKIYLAIPYSSIDHELSFRVANKKTAELMNSGYIVYSPISHSHIIAKDHDLPKGWEFWKRIDREFITWSDELWVIKLKGWKESSGVQAEIMIALEMGKTIKSMEV
jgi:hypothetical protein